MPQPVSPCPDDELFRQLLDRQLPARELAVLHAHLDRCSDCMALLLELARAAEGAAEEDAIPEQVEEYRLLRPLGQGAMGQVFLAHDTLLDRPVALKFLAARKPSRSARERFFVEARAIARLSHPNVVRVYRVGETGQRPYLVSEVVQGRSLDQLPLPLSVTQVLHIGLGICRGLGAAHRRGVLHRDIKPANVILSDDGEVKLLDFGLAKLLDEPWPSPSPSVAEEGAGAEGSKRAQALTRTGAILGTPCYMAPELWSRQAATEQSDIYALGALLYELAAGRPPHRAKSLRELSHAVQKKEIRPLREVARGIPRQLSELVERCLRKDPQERFPSVQDLESEIESLRERTRESEGSRGAPEQKLRSAQSGHRALRLVRRSELAAVLSLLARDGLVVVAGDADVGKSSFCRDALLPAIRGGALRDGRRWTVLLLSPGPSPLVALTGTLAPWLGADPKELLSRLHSEPAAIASQLGERQEEATGLCLFIDQLEELLTRSEAGEAAAMAEFLSQLARESRGLRALLAVRGEYLSRLAALPGLDSELTRALYLLRPLSAASAFAAARRLHPEDPRMLRKLGAAYRELGHHDAAAAVLERAVELLPDDARSRRLLALAHFSCRHLDGAIEQARAGVRLQPERARAFRLLGRLCLFARDFAQAGKALEQAVSLQPAHRLAHRWLGEALLASGRAAEAALCFERAAELGLLRATSLDPAP